jgi:hypothetical protein
MHEQFCAERVLLGSDSVSSRTPPPGSVSIRQHLPPQLDSEVSSPLSSGLARKGHFFEAAAEITSAQL